MINRNKMRVLFSSKLHTQWLEVWTWRHQMNNCFDKQKTTILRQNCSRALETPVPSTSPNPLAPFPQESARNLHNPNRLLKWMHLKWKDVDVFLAGSLFKWLKLAWETAQYLISVPQTLMCAMHIMGLIFLHRTTKSNQENHISKD